MPGCPASCGPCRRSSRRSGSPAGRGRDKEHGCRPGCGRTGGCRRPVHRSDAAPADAANRPRPGGPWWTSPRGSGPPPAYAMSAPVDLGGSTQSCPPCGGGAPRRRAEWCAPSSVHCHRPVQLALLVRLALQRLQHPLPGAVLRPLLVVPEVPETKNTVTTIGRTTRYKWPEI
jgi:hypothetical protein